MATTPYIQLSPRGQVRRLRAVARHILPRYAFRGSPTLRFINHGENTTFRVELASPPRGWNADPRWHPQRALLRIHRTSYNWPAEIASELAWIAALASETDLGLPQPVAQADGSLLTRIAEEGLGGERVVTLTRWVAGRMMWRTPTAAHLEQLGAVMAQLHDHAAHWSPPADFTRPHWRDRGLATDDGNSDRGCGSLWGLVPKEDRRLLQTIRRRAVKTVADLEAADGGPGLIHGDLHLRNLVFRSGQACPIDFDDALYAPWLIDLVNASFSRPDTLEAILRGYRKIRPFPERQLKIVPLLGAARAANVLLWVIGRAQDNRRFLTVLERFRPLALARCEAVR